MGFQGRGLCRNEWVKRREGRKCGEEVNLMSDLGVGFWWWYDFIIVGFLNNGHAECTNRRLKDAFRAWKRSEGASAFMNASRKCVDARNRVSMNMA